MQKEIKNQQNRNIVYNDNSNKGVVYEEDGTDDDEETKKYNKMMQEERIETELVSSDDDDDVVEVLQTPILPLNVDRNMHLRSGTSVEKENGEIPAFTPPSRYRVGPVYSKSECPKPSDVVKLLWDDEIMNNFWVNTNSYAECKNDKEWPEGGISKDDLYRFFGLILFFGTLKVSERRLVWEINSKLYNKFVAGVMSRHKFEAILRNLHWYNTGQLSKEERKARNKIDCFWRVAPLLDRLAKSFQSRYNCGQAVDGDEQGIPTKSYHTALQFNSDKPFKFFFKVYALNDSISRFMSNFYLFRGADKTRKSDIPASAYPILHLTSPPKYHNKWHICYVDNYFNGLPLLQGLWSRKIHTCGTLRANRVRTAEKLYYDKKGAGKGHRGEMKQHMLSDHCYVTSWFDKRPVNMLHSFKTMKGSCLRHDKDHVTGGSKETIVERPTVINHYNAGMGGTDGMDQYLSYYRTSVRTKRWPHSIIFHFLLASVTNAFIMHKEAHGLNKHENNGNLFSFIMSVVDDWCVMGLQNEVSDVLFAVQPKHYTPMVVPRSDARFCGAHFPMKFPNYIVHSEEYTERMIHRCKRYGCNKRTSTYCKTCGVTLCIDAVNGTTCFEIYHTYVPT